MALTVVYSLQNVWPFSVFKFDDLSVSNGLVRKLSIPEHTKEFVLAVREPDSQSVIYILSVQNLSKRSVHDAECLIRELRPDAVVAQVDHSTLTDTESIDDEEIVPTSSFGVLKRCFVDKINKEKYENVAGTFALREIFGTDFHGHFLAAKKVAKEVGASFLLLESPSVKTSALDNHSGDVDAGSKLLGLIRNLIPQKVGSAAVSSSRRFFLNNNVESHMVKLLSSNMDISVSKLNPSGSTDSNEILPMNNFEVPQFAQSIYPLLVDLHNIFVDLPSIGRALAFAQKMLIDVNRGEVVDTRTISEVNTFQVAVEGLRIALNNAGRLPINKKMNPKSTKIDFSELPVEEKSHAFLAHALQNQAKKFKTIVAIVDASSLAGLRRQWNTVVPPDVREMVGELVKDCESDEEIPADKKRLFSNKPVVAVGAGATAALGASSLSKAVPASTLMKVASLKVPVSLKLFLTQTQKAMAMVLSKTVGPSKVLAPGLSTSGAKVTSVIKGAASAEKIRTVAHSIIASAEKTSFSAMRTAFYEIMRKRRVKPIGVLPWATFGSSVATCTGLLVYGDGIECAAESLPTAPSIASLGRGIQSLREASQAARLADGDRIQKAIESLMYRLKKVKIQ
ncbi:hypothetical protein HS088_TW06G01171 [Tripterygium wilfordii]|uniref:Transmembrane protein n=1 Tax=Tripterygium wilfordii TaxID=458696 RepID=A0A7J7DL88_TRIWF|nr:uncharacterized protein LOC120000439 [Tripterygium wilfordii]KAF5746994.1 hypothetical protein HS088_TW06G01171 [Tripterygium wilfordii]